MEAFKVLLKTKGSISYWLAFAFVNMTSYFQFPHLLVYHDTTAWQESPFLTTAHPDLLKHTVTRELGDFFWGSLNVIDIWKMRPWLMQWIHKKLYSNNCIVKSVSCPVALPLYWFLIAIASSALILPFNHLNVLSSSSINLVARDIMICWLADINALIGLSDHPTLVWWIIISAYI